MQVSIRHEPGLLPDYLRGAHIICGSGKPQLIEVFGHMSCFSNKERGVAPGFKRFCPSQETGYNLEILTK